MIEVMMLLTVTCHAATTVINLTRNLPGPAYGHGMCSLYLVANPFLCNATAGNVLRNNFYCYRSTTQIDAMYNIAKYTVQLC